jgi:ribosome maturation factor RimP
LESAYSDYGRRVCPLIPPWAPGGDIRRNEWAKAHFSFEREIYGPGGNPLLEAANMALSLEQIRFAAERVAASQGLDIVEIEYLGGGKHRLLRIFIEKNREERARRAEEAKAAEAKNLEGNGVEGSIVASLSGAGLALDQVAWVTHEDCEQFSRDFGAVLDVEDLVPGSEYTLEVSSPGLDRKLTAPADYERFRQSLVKVRTFAPVAGNRHWQGRLVDVKAEGIVLDVTAGKQKSGKKASKPAEQMLEVAFAEIERANLVPEFF